MSLLDDIINGTVEVIAEAFGCMAIFVILLLYLFIFGYPIFNW